jgi:hypothetical protein
MTVDEIRSWKEAEPFRKFLLVLANGEELLVPRRGSLGFDPDGRFVVYPFVDRGGYRIVPSQDISFIRPAESDAA